MSKKRILTLMLTVLVMLSACLVTAGQMALTVSAESEMIETAAVTTPAESVTEPVAEEDDLGGAFSVERLIYAGQMLLLGMAMVFVVLAILWMILLIFKKVMYDGANKKSAAEEKPAEPAPAPVEVAPVEEPVAATEDDGALAAAITAAVAAMIASDEALSEQFAGGFRVVSFRRKSGKGAWNR